MIALTLIYVGQFVSDRSFITSYYVHGLEAAHRDRRTKVMCYALFLNLVFGESKKPIFRLDFSVSTC